MSQGSLFSVSAPSGGGKTSLTRALVPAVARHGVTATISVSFTTRAARPGELDGVHYHFVDEAGFAEKIARGDFLERSEERRGGKECVRTCRSRWSRDH